LSETSATPYISGGRHQPRRPYGTAEAVPSVHCVPQDFSVSTRRTIQRLRENSVGTIFKSTKCGNPGKKKTTDSGFRARFTSGTGRSPLLNGTTAAMGSRHAPIRKRLMTAPRPCRRRHDHSGGELPRCGTARRPRMTRRGGYSEPSGTGRQQDGDVKMISQPGLESTKPGGKSIHPHTRRLPPSGDHGIWFCCL